MATRAILTVDSPNETFNMSFSHDGNPAFILEVIASVGKNIHGITKEALRDAYFAQYGEEKTLVECSFSLISDFSWEYRIDQHGRLTVKCYELWNDSDQDQPVSPMVYLKVVRDECRDKISGKISECLKKLNTVGISCDKEAVFS